MKKERNHKAIAIGTLLFIINLFSWGLLIFFTGIFSLLGLLIACTLIPLLIHKGEKLPSILKVLMWILITITTILGLYSYILLAFFVKF